MIWPLIAYFAFVVFLVTAVLVASYLLGQRHSEPATGEPYEGGIVSEGSAHVRFSIADVKKEPRNKMPHEMKGKKISIPWDVRFV